MALTPGTRLGPYEITGLLGEGGMGQVYRASDTNLKRHVAIKVLPASVAADPDRLARFQREAEVLAALNHPNIAAIYGLERAGDMTALVMELVDGDDLSERISKGPLPLDEALPIARQIAEALEAAHEQGIIHRDLKPANIKLRDDGTVKVLDFGLAKALDARAGVAGRPGRDDLSASPTLTSPAMTQAGMILGTAAYMAPEQARGKTVDKRADVWAFGAVLFEMLSGQRAFRGEDVTDTLALVVRGEPGWDALPPTVPARVRQVLRSCLQKDPRQRIAHMQDVRLALEGAFETATPQTTAPAREPRSRMRVFAGLAVGALMGAFVVAAAMWSGTGRAPGLEAPARLSVMVPANRPIFFSGDFPTRALAIAPDGSQLVYVGTNPDAPAGQLDGTQLELRDLGSLAVRDLPGTADARQPFFSPDGQWVAFFTTAGDLKKVALAGGNPITLLTKINGARWGFGVWTEDQTIIFGTNTSGLRRVSAEGGVATDLTTLDATRERWHSHPALVPSGQAVLYWTFETSGAKHIDAVTLGSGERRRVVENGYAPIVLRSGHLLFQRDGAPLIAPFDLERLAVTGPAGPLVDAVRPDSPSQGTFPLAELAVSRSGTLAYVPDADTATALVLVGRDGASQPLGPPPQNFAFPRVSPDGRSVAFLQMRGQQRDVLIYDLARGSTTRLTQDEVVYGLAWSPDGRSLAVASRKKDAFGTFLKTLDGRERLLVATPPGVTVIWNANWSPDGTELAYTVQTGSQHDIWVLTMGETPTTRPFLTGAAAEYSPAFSPDGRWLAYESDESGRPEVYVQAYPKGDRLAVSTGGGSGPVWRRDGKELYFAGADAGVNKMMAVPVTPDGASLRLGAPTPLFNRRAPGPTGAVEVYAGALNNGPGYDILADGRFVMLRGADQTNTREIVLVQHWFEELKRLVPPTR